MALDVSDRPAEGATRNSLALLLRDMTRFEEALGHLEKALTIARDVGHTAGEGATLNNLGLVSRSMGRYTDALDYYQRSLPLSREAGDLRGEGLALNNLGRLCFEHLARPRGGDRILRAGPGSLPAGAASGARRVKSFRTGPSSPRRSAIAGGRSSSTRRPWPSPGKSATAPTKPPRWAAWPRSWSRWGEARRR